MNLQRWTCIVGGLAVALTFAACGETTKSVVPPPVNPFEAARVGSDSTLEVMTWNIENFPKAGSTTISWVKQTVEGLQPDIVAVQEIGNVTQFDVLASQLTGWNGTRASSDSFQNLGFLYRTDGGLVFNSSYEILANHESTFMRIPYVMEATWNGTPVVVIALHLKAQEDGSADDDKRRNSCLLLAEYVEANYPDKRVFIVGDMNDMLIDAAPANVFQNFLSAPESWRFTDMTIAQGSTENWSYHSGSFASHLDHILVNEQVFPALDGPTSLTMVLPLQLYIPGGWSKYDYEVSDHRPVILRLVP